MKPKRAVHRQLHAIPPSVATRSARDQIFLLEGEARSRARAGERRRGAKSRPRARAPARQGPSRTGTSTGSAIATTRSRRSGSSSPCANSPEPEPRRAKSGACIGSTSFSCKRAARRLERRAAPSCSRSGARAAPSSMPTARPSFRRMRRARPDAFPQHAGRPSLRSFPAIDPAGCRELRRPPPRGPLRTRTRVLAAGSFRAGPPFVAPRDVPPPFGGLALLLSTASPARGRPSVNAGRASRGAPVGPQGSEASRPQEGGSQHKGKKS